MKHLSSLVLLGLALSSAAGAQDRPAHAELAITHANVVDVESGRVLSDHTVLVRGGRIVSVAPSGQGRVPRRARVVNAAGGYLIPGLWDAHAHVTFAGERALPVYAAHGVTAVRDLGGRLPDLLALRGRVVEGALVGPALYVAGPNLEGAWWLDLVVRLAASDSVLRSFPFLEASPRYRIATPADARAAVDSLRRLGVDVIKFRNLRGDEFRALAAEARLRGVPLVGHAPRDVALSEAADLGMGSIEHMETVVFSLGDAPPAERSAQFAWLARRGTAITATLVTDVAYRQTPDSLAYAIIADTLNLIDPRRRFLSPEMLAFWKFGLDLKKLEGPNDWAASHRRQLADLRLANQAGVPILVGTDLGASLVYPGSSVHEEMRLLVEQGGMSPLEVLRGATLYPARTLGLAGSVGAITVGKEADLVLLDANPLDDIRNTQRIRGVVLDGRYLDRVTLDGLLESAARRMQKTTP
ncbi:MAG TPA: amidohydrolase family protein [Longimicrobium sp.]|nr:amidohydrolase family protein [Longimicrobium sp.]